jgi:hypothetical protein
VRNVSAHRRAPWTTIRGSIHARSFALSELPLVDRPLGLNRLSNSVQRAAW